MNGIDCEMRVTMRLTWWGCIWRRRNKK